MMFSEWAALHLAVYRMKRAILEELGPLGQGIIDTARKKRRRLTREHRQKYPRCKDMSLSVGD